MLVFEDLDGNVLKLMKRLQFSFAGYFVEKSTYSPNYIVVGRGATHAIAEKDAISAISKLTDNL